MPHSAITWHSAARSGAPPSAGARVAVAPVSATACSGACSGGRPPRSSAMSGDHAVDASGELVAPRGGELTAAGQHRSLVWEDGEVVLLGVPDLNVADDLGLAVAASAGARLQLRPAAPPGWVAVRLALAECLHVAVLHVDLKHPDP